MNDDIIHNIWFDDRLESYASYFDHEWANQFGALSVGTPLTIPAGKLCSNWKAAAITSAMPWLLVHSLCNIGDGILQSKEPSIAKYQRKYADLLLGEVPGLSNMKRKQVIAGIEKIGERVKNAVDVAQSVKFDPQHVWEQFIHAETRYTFCLGIWGTQRHCFSAIYFAYEYFIQRCIGIGIGKPDRRFKEGFEVLEQNANTVLGKSVVDRCIKCQPVQLARRVRNDIAHNGGIVEGDTSELTKAGFRIEDDEIQIMAPQTRELFDRLKVYATEVTEATLKYLNRHVAT